METGIGEQGSPDAKRQTGEYFMKFENDGWTGFFSEMSEYQITAREFFSATLLDSLARNFGVRGALIFYFDTQGNFLAWTSSAGAQVDGPEHPYRKFAVSDVVRNVIYQEAVRDRLTYFNVTPRLYRSTDIIHAADYEHSAYVRFLEENFQAHYSVTMAFGINAYIQVAFFKCREDGDFTADEMEQLREIYVFVANAYKTFKKYEQAQIISSIQGEVVASGERAYLVTDDFMHVMSYNDTARDYLEDLLGAEAVEQFGGSRPCTWLPFLLGSEEEETGTSGEKNKTEENACQSGPARSRVYTRVVKNYIFKVYTYDRTYSNGIVDRYHWITISRKEAKQDEKMPDQEMLLTPTEQKVAELMYSGLTYRAIADELVVSYHTVKKHVQNIYSKCGVNSRFELYRWLEERES
jgi:DNA-binding CsgD family transcriptional regulator